MSADGPSVRAPLGLLGTTGAGCREVGADVATWPAESKAVARRPMLDQKLEQDVTEITSAATQPAYLRIEGAAIVSSRRVLRRFNPRNCLSVEPLPAARSPTSGWDNDPKRMPS